ncbi:MAG: AIR synthase family protein [Anaerolineae bacterium]|nr:AIR synthase family protein [Anaerolineae bacterium]
MSTDHDATNTLYPIGKLPQDDLLKLLGELQTPPDPRLIQGPGLSCDAAVVAFGNRYLVTKSDPITFATDEIGWYAVNVNANDIACLGAKPEWFIATLLLPEGQTDQTLVKQIFHQIHAACAQLGARLIGGHTEITHKLNRPIVVGNMFGEIAPGDLIRSNGAQPGDKLILTKGIAVEGTALLAREMRDKLSRTISNEKLDKAANMLHNPGISVVKDALLMTTAGEVHAMHDPTEGGVATGLQEMMQAAGLGAVIEEAALPFYQETLDFCDTLGLDPLGLIASGSLLAAVNPNDAETITHYLERHGIAVSIIGVVREEPGILLQGQAGNRPLPVFARDEITRIFES